MSSKKRPSNESANHKTKEKKNCMPIATGVYILPEIPPPLKFFPVLGIFLRSFKLLKGILTCVLSLFFPPLFPSSFIKSSFKFFRLSLWKKIPPPRGRGNGQNIYPFYQDNSTVTLEWFINMLWTSIKGIPKDTHRYLLKSKRVEFMMMVVIREPYFS